MDASAVRSALIAIHSQILDLLIGKLLEMCDEIANAQVERYSGILTRLHQKPADVEQVKDAEDFIDNLPVTLGNLDADTKLLLDLWDVHESTFRRASDQRMILKLNVIAWPKQIWDRVAVLRLELDGARMHFQDEMHAEQADFEQTLLDLAAEVSSLIGYTDMAKIEQIALHVRSLSEKLTEATQKSFVFMNRQSIFGEEVREYTELGDISKEFEPYRNLWESVDKWLRYREEWMNQPLTSVDAEFIEKEVMTH